jgi:hypothetical protein
VFSQAGVLHPAAVIPLTADNRSVSVSNADTIKA